MTFVSSKSSLKSKTLVGIVVALLAFGLQHFGLNVPEESILEVVLKTVELAGLLFAGWGRFRAEEKVKLL